MKRTMNNFILFVFLATCIAWINCSDSNDENPLEPNPLEPSQLAGTYTFVSFTDKIANFTTNAGDIADLDGQGNLPVGAITATLELTVTTYATTFTITPAGAAPVKLTASGTYTISGFTLTLVTTSSALPGVEIGTVTYTISLSGNRLTYQDNEVKLVFDKQ